ncbi:hypothetical protein [Aquitalea sp. LB_tupeE]|uniref:hypothetical protein n=1 Tax=Aquitalea sp. LB_tupeE TaxID=2748078 RepID=UPI0021054982|nr:hypothetical protein [Aquitalea sp. LB_tupeE]
MNAKSFGKSGLHDDGRRVVYTMALLFRLFPKNSNGCLIMYMVLIGWLYVVLMLAVAQNSLWATFSILFFLGFLPTLFIARMTRRRLRKRQELAQEQENQGKTLE